MLLEKHMAMQQTILTEKSALNGCIFTTGTAGPSASPESFQIRTRYIAIEPVTFVQAAGPSKSGCIFARPMFHIAQPSVHSQPRLQFYDDFGLDAAGREPNATQQVVVNSQTPQRALKACSNDERLGTLDTTPQAGLIRTLLVMH